VGSELDATIYVFGDCELDLGLHELRFEGQVRAVEPQVFDLLAYLIKHRDRLVDKDELNEKIWHGRFVSDASLTTALKQARQAIGDSGQKQALIKTFPRRGYRFVAAAKARRNNADDKVGAKKIAVLPFENMSSDPEQSYFADGMTDDLITHLSKVENLFVISRNSVFTYKGRNVKVEAIADDLGVRFVLEGSVRRAGSVIRINAQLIDAETGDHIWADLFDKDVTDIFALQDEVIGKIVAALRINLTTQDKNRQTNPPTENLQAYELVLRAREIHYGFQLGGMTKATDLYRRAQELDPHYADAYSGEAAAAAWALRYNLFGVYKPDEARNTADQAIAKALAIMPNNAAALGARALLLSTDRSYDQAISFARQAVGAEPNNAAALRTLADCFMVAGRSEEAIAEIEAALLMDPKPTPQDTFATGEVYLTDGQYDRALDYYRDVLQRDPENWQAHNGIMACCGELGLKDEAKASVGARLQQWPQFNVQATALHRHHWEPSTFERWLTSYRKGGAPEWPYGFQGSEDDRLDNKDLEKLLLGHKVTGKGQFRGAYTLKIAKDGHWVYADNDIEFKGHGWAEDNFWCHVTDGSAAGRINRSAYYRNPTGRREMLNEYVNVDTYDVFWFSVDV
jgi:adenylate cyclase